MRIPIWLLILVAVLIVGDVVMFASFADWANEVQPNPAQSIDLDRAELPQYDFMPFLSRVLKAGFISVGVLAAELALTMVAYKLSQRENNFAREVMLGKYRYDAKRMGQIENSSVDADDSVVVSPPNPARSVDLNVSEAIAPEPTNVATTDDESTSPDATSAADAPATTEVSPTSARIALDLDLTSNASNQSDRIDDDKPDADQGNVQVEEDDDEYEYVDEDEDEEDDDTTDDKSSEDSEEEDAKEDEGDEDEDVEDDDATEEEADEEDSEYEYVYVEEGEELDDDEYEYVDDDEEDEEEGEGDEEEDSDEYEYVDDDEDADYEQTDEEEEQAGADARGLETQGVRKPDDQPAISDDALKLDPELLSALKKPADTGNTKGEASPAPAPAPARKRKRKKKS